jgi:hypothetical protein
METSSILCDALRELGYNPKSYSRWGDYGGMCLSVVVPNYTGGLIAKIIDTVGDTVATDEFVNNIERMLARVHNDTTLVVYWPHLQYVDE